MKLVSFCAAAVLLSSTAFSQAKPADLSPAAMNQAPVSQTTSNHVNAAKADMKTKKIAHKTHKTVAHAKKASRKHAANAKKRMHTASAKTQKKMNKTVAR